MMNSSSSQMERRLASLERHLKQENPVLLRVVQSFRELDWVAYRLGLLTPEESYATQVPWWPLIAVLGTFSSGKSTFINGFLGAKLQRTGNQAVDDKFTVVCYSMEERSHTLPGLSLDADPRFPFYQMSREIDLVSHGEGRRIDAYLQLKTCSSEKLRGKIIIDSPGFDADAQRTSTLRITDHIINLSDLVLVFFDARHPEPGAMKDTLDHLVANTINRPDSNKFLFILNQIDCTARDDNLEDVVAAWQRALAQSGLTAGRFYQIYDKGAANPMDDDNVRVRFETKREEDMGDIQERIQRVEVERAYRIIGVLEHAARTIQENVVPMTSDLLHRWRKQTLIADGVIFGLLSTIALLWYLTTDFIWPWPLLEGLSWSGGIQGATLGHGISFIALLALLGGLGYIHFQVRKFSAFLIKRKLAKEIATPELRESIKRCFDFNTSPIRSIFHQRPAGWGIRTERRIQAVLRETDTYVQNLNDQFTNPSGKAGVKPPRIQLDIT